MFVSRLTGDCESVPVAGGVLTINLNQSKKTEMNRMFIEAGSLITTLFYLKTSPILIPHTNITTHYHNITMMFPNDHQEKKYEKPD